MAQCECWQWAMMGDAVVPRVPSLGFANMLEDAKRGVASALSWGKDEGDGFGRSLISARTSLCPAPLPNRAVDEGREVGGFDPRAHGGCRR
jgi:hypothetical protein